MGHILTLLPSSITRHRLKRALRLEIGGSASHEVVHTERTKQLVDRLHSDSWDLVVLDPASIEFPTALPKHDWDVPVILYGRFSPRSVRTVVRWAVECATPIVHTVGVDDDPRSVLRAVHECLAGAQVDTTFAALLESVEGAAAQYLRRTLRATHKTLSVEELSRRFFCSPRTLRRRFAQAGLASPRVVIAHCRLLRAAALMRSGKRSVASTAQVLGFGTAENLCHHFARHLGCAPTSLSYGRGFDRLTDRVLASLVTERSR